MRNEEIDWEKIADLMWHKMTIQQACEELDLNWHEVVSASTIEQRKYLVDTSMLANARDEYLNG